MLLFFKNQNIRMYIILLRLKILYSFQTVHLMLQKSLEVISNSKAWSFGWFSQRSKATSWLTRKPSTPEKWKQFYPLLVLIKTQILFNHWIEDSQKSALRLKPLVFFFLPIQPSKKVWCSCESERFPNSSSDK